MANILNTLGANNPLHNKLRKSPHSQKFNAAECSYIIGTHLYCFARTYNHYAFILINPYVVGCSLLVYKVFNIDW